MDASRSRIWFALFVLAVFVLGGATGFIVARHAPPFADRPGPFAEDVPPGGPGRGPGRRGGPPLFGRGPGPGGLPPEMANRLANELQLDEGQRTRLRQVLDDHRAKFEQVHRDARERFDAEQRELFDAIRGVLRPDQVQRFDRFINGRRP